MFKIFWLNFVPSCFLHIDGITLWYAYLFFQFVFRSNFLLVCNYINDIYLFQKLNVFLSFREVQNWLTQLPSLRKKCPYSELFRSAIFPPSAWINPFTIREKAALSSIVLWTTCVFDMKTENYLPVITVYVKGIIVVVRQ